MEISSANRTPKIIAAIVAGILSLSPVLATMYSPGQAGRYMFFIFGFLGLFASIYLFKSTKHIAGKVLLGLLSAWYGLFSFCIFYEFYQYGIHI